MTEPIDDDATTELWVYLGTRPGQSVAKVHGYRRPNGDENWFKRAFTTYASVGYLYRVSFTTADDTTFSVKRTTEFTDERAEDFNELVLADRVAAGKLAAEQLERNAKRKNDIDEALAPLIEIAKSLKATAHREALITYVERAIWRA